jgi:hypothetical protein
MLPLSLGQGHLKFSPARNFNSLNYLCQNIPFVVKYYTDGGITMGELLNAKDLVSLLLNSLFSLDKMS